MKRIPIAAAKRIAEEYGYDQVVVYARKTGPGGGEHLTTYGTTPTHCRIAARMADVLKGFMGWRTLRSDPVSPTARVEGETDADYICRLLKLAREK